MARNDPPLKIRMPTDLKETLQESSKANGRSMNSEILHRLKQTLQPSPTTHDSELLEAIRALLGRHR